MQDFEVQHTDGLTIYVLKISRYIFRTCRQYSKFIRFTYVCQTFCVFTEITMTIVLLCCGDIFFIVGNKYFGGICCLYLTKLKCRRQVSWNLIW